MNFNVLVGLPRSGSTLLCNILNQNQAVYASSTSVLYTLMASAVKTYSSLPETKGDLGRNREYTETRLRDLLKSMVDAWYRGQNGRIIFDKNRGWSSDVLLLRTLYPKSKVVVLVRDLREVFASIEKQHRKTALFNIDDEKSLYTRADVMFSPKGMVGHCLEGIRDLMDRCFDVFWCRYEDFAKHPEQMLNRLYCYLGTEAYGHQYDDVQNLATDPDHLYLYKYPHRGEDAVKEAKPLWMEYMSPTVATLIMEKFTWYNEAFGYTSNGLRAMKLPNVVTVQ